MTHHYGVPAPLVARPVCCRPPRCRHIVYPLPAVLNRQPLMQTTTTQQTLPPQLAAAALVVMQHYGVVSLVVGARAQVALQLRVVPAVAPAAAAVPLWFAAPSCDLARHELAFLRCRGV